MKHLAYWSVCAGIVLLTLGVLWLSGLPSWKGVFDAFGAAVGVVFILAFIIGPFIAGIRKERR